MRILKLVAGLTIVATSLCGSAQVSVQCPSFPCTITVTAPAPPPPPPPPPSTVSIAPLSVNFITPLNVLSAIQFVTVTNPTANALPFTDAMSGTGFNWGGKGTCGPPLKPNSTCTESVTCMLTSATTSTGTMTISYGTVVGGTPNIVTKIPLTCSTAPIVVVHGIALSWQASSTAGVNYNVYRSQVTGGPYGLNTSIPVVGTTYTDPSAVVGTTYFYVVRAVSSAGVESTNSNEVQITR